MQHAQCCSVKQKRHSEAQNDAPQGGFSCSADNSPSGNPSKASPVHGEVARRSRDGGVVAEKHVDFSQIFGEFVLLSTQPLSQPCG